MTGKIKMSFIHIHCLLEPTKSMVLWPIIIFAKISRSVMSNSLFSKLWTVAHQTPLSKGLSRQEYWGGVPCPPPEDLPNPGIKPTSPASPALAGRFFTTSTTWKPIIILFPTKKDTRLPMMIYYNTGF